MAEPSPTALALEDAIALVKRYTVFVWTDEGSGSGVSIGRGQVLTNNHVVQGASTVNVRFADGRQEPVRVVRTDARRDLALLQSSFPDTPVAPLRDARGLRDGESLLAIGYPLTQAIGARDPTVTRGIASSRWQSPQGVWYVQTDAPANPGNSGGPLTDTQGQVVGIVTFGIRQAVGLNFGLASDEVQAFLNGNEVQAPSQDTPAARPELTSTTISPQAAKPGAVLTFNYEITYDGPPVTLVLGASVRPAGGGTWISDPLEDTRVTVRPGKQTFSRQFHLPPTTDAGPYDVAWGLLGTDMQTSYGLVTLLVALTVVGSTPPGTASGPLAAAMSRVADAGYRVLDTSSYDPGAPIRVLVGMYAASADGANQRAFFFAGDRYLGTDARDASAHIGFVRQAGSTITLRYTLYRPSNALCCPSAGTADVRYRWDGNKLVPLDPIPDSDWKATHQPTVENERPRRTLCAGLRFARRRPRPLASFQLANGLRLASRAASPGAPCGRVLPPRCCARRGLPILLGVREKYWSAPAILDAERARERRNTERRRRHG